MLRVGVKADEEHVLFDTLRLFLSSFLFYLFFFFHSFISFIPTQSTVLNIGSKGEGEGRGVHVAMFLIGGPIYPMFVQK